MTRGWLIHLPLVRAPHPGCPGHDPDRPREMLLARVPARTLMRCQQCLPVCVRETTGAGCIQHTMSATGPVRCLRASPALRQAWSEIRPGGWLCTPLPREDRPPAEPRWPPPPLTRRTTFGHKIRGIPSRLHRNVRDPSGSGSAGEYGMGVEGGEKNGGRRELSIPVRICNFTNENRYNPSSDFRSEEILRKPQRTPTRSIRHEFTR